MSTYSGRCDIYDVCVVMHNYTDEELKNNVKIYIHGNNTPLKIESQKDLIPYYPYIIGSACHDNVERKSVMHITSESSVDREERESLEWYLKEILKIYNRCKRKKIEFDVADAVKTVCWYDLHQGQITEIANRVKDSGKKATLENIHLPIYEYYRSILVEEMIKNGLNPCDYGDYERFIKKEV